MNMSINYAKHDKGMQYLADKKEVAKKLGFQYVSEAYDKLHAAGVFPSAIAEIFGVSKCCIALNLKKMQATPNKPGGRNYSKLTEDQVGEIFLSKKPTKVLMAEYDISFATVYDIKKGRTWKHITTGD